MCMLLCHSHAPLVSNEKLPTENGGKTHKYLWRAVRGKGWRKFVELRNFDERCPVTPSVCYFQQCTFTYVGAFSVCEDMVSVCGTQPFAECFARLRAEISRLCFAFFGWWNSDGRLWNASRGCGADVNVQMWWGGGGRDILRSLKGATTMQQPQWLLFPLASSPLPLFFSPSSYHCWF